MPFIENIDPFLAKISLGTKCRTLKEILFDAIFILFFLEGLKFYKATICNLHLPFRAKSYSLMKNRPEYMIKETCLDEILILPLPLNCWERVRKFYVKFKALIFIIFRMYIGSKQAY